jgi:hypothetical protein
MFSQSSVLCSKGGPLDFFRFQKYFVIGGKKSQNSIIINTIVLV